MDWLINLITNLFKDTPEKRLQRFKRDGIKYLSSWKVPVFEKKSELLAPQFISYLLRIFRPLWPLLQLLKIEFREKQGGPLRAFLVDSITTDQQRAFLENLTPEKIRHRLADVDRDTFYREVESSIAEYVASFSEADRQRVDTRYTLLHRFSHLTQVDFDAFFRDFDAKFSLEKLEGEGNFQPRDARYYLDDFRKIDAVLASLEFDNELKESINEFLRFREREPIPDREIKEIFQKLRQLREDRIFEKIIAISTGNPDYHTVPLDITDNVVNAALERIVADTRAVIDQTFAQLKSSHIEALSQTLFGAEKVPPLKHYNEELSAKITAMKGPPFRFARELYLLKLYILVKYHPHLKPFLTQLMIKAMWNDTETQKIIGDAFYQLNELQNRIAAFDEDVGDNGKIGSRLRRAMLAIHRDARALDIIAEVVAYADEGARQLISDGIRNIKSVFTMLQTLEKTYREKNKRLLKNILDFDGGKTPAHIEKAAQLSQDILLFLNILKSCG